MYSFKLKMLVVFLLISNILSALSFAGSQGGGADLGGGTDGRFVSIAKARVLALKALELTQANMLSEHDLTAFYELNRLTLINEVKSSEIVVKPSSEVILEHANGSKSYKNALTKLNPLAEIKISEELGMGASSIYISLQDLVLIILHEVGHHLGVAQEDDQFLDRLALSIINSTKSRDKTAKTEMEQSVIWAPCNPDQRPTRTPHCLLVKNYTADGNIIFHLKRELFGTCQSTIVAAGSIRQVFQAMHENEIENKSYNCATVSFFDPMRLKPTNSLTPHCLIQKVAGAISFTHSNSDVPLMVGSKKEIIEFVQKISGGFCGQGIFGLELIIEK